MLGIFNYLLNYMFISFTFLIYIYITFTFTSLIYIYISFTFTLLFFMYFLQNVIWLNARTGLRYKRHILHAPKYDE